jgi:uncharacterized protein
VAPGNFRLVLDTNIIVRAFINLQSSSGRLLRACQDRRIVTLLSRPVLKEYRIILADEKLVSRYPQLQRPEVHVALRRLIYVSDNYRRVTARFSYPRDPKDSHLIELAIAGNATHLISTDNDLLTLPGGRDEAATRFRQRLPRIEVLKPDEFIRRYGRSLGIE